MAKVRPKRRSNAQPATEGTGLADGRGIEIDPRILPAPEMRGVADTIRTDATPEGVQAVFENSRYPEPLLAVVFPKGTMYNALLRHVKAFREQTSSHLRELGVRITPVQRLERPFSEPPMPVHVVRVGRLGLEAELECYYVSIGKASLYASLKERGRVPVEPIGRIYLPTALLLGLLEYLDAQGNEADDDED